jgi:hypothetical protein
MPKFSDLRLNSILMILSLLFINSCKKEGTIKDTAQKNPLIAPTLLKPANNMEDVLLMPTFAWRKNRLENEGQIYYKFWIGLDTAKFKMSQPYIIRDTVYAYQSPLVEDTTYYWKITAVSDKFTKESEIWNFKTGKVCKYDVRLKSQEQINEFGKNKYIELWGALIISEDTEGSIVDLSPLSSITKVNSALTISDNKSLKTLKGLENISIIGGAMKIAYNNNLESIANLSNITDVNDIEISENLSLSNIDCFNNLTSLYQDINIIYNDKLVTVNGFNSINVIKGSIRFQENKSLKYINGFQKTTTIKEGIVIWKNPHLKSFAGLNKVTSVGESVLINENDSLNTLQGLEKISKIGYSLSIFENNSLVTLSGIDSLKFLGTNLVITYNNKLENFCALKNLILNNNMIDRYHISFNKYNPTITDIEKNCK